jgi:RNA recognition motif-containing protein
MLEDMFTIVGNVRAAHIVRDEGSGTSRGIGLVEMATEEEAQNCIHFYNGHPEVVVRKNLPHVPTEAPFKNVSSGRRTKSRAK